MPFKSIPAPFPVGHTPLFPLRRLDPGLSAQVSLWAKAEWYNPSGSVKDRPAWSILHTALNERRLDGGRILLDATSGNIGIAYTTVAAVIGLINSVIAAYYYLRVLVYMYMKEPEPGAPIAKPMKSVAVRWSFAPPPTAMRCA